MMSTASSPVPSSNSSAVSPSPSTPNGSISSQRSPSFDLPKQNLRGIKKPKCIKCGNIARSRCPFQSCKSCCSKAQNPCHIHVLKVNGTLPDKAPSANSPTLDQPSNDSASFVSGAAMRLSSLRQLSSAFVNSLRTRKPMTKQDAININKWRFSKLKEHIDTEIEIEDEAFDRYMKNVSLLEEIFSADSLKEKTEEDGSADLVNRLKIRLKSSAGRSNSSRDRVRKFSEDGLDELKRIEVSGSDEDYSEEFKRRRMLMRSRVERTNAVDDMIDKMIKARSEDDLKLCHDIMMRIYDLDPEHDGGAKRGSSEMTRHDIDEDHLLSVENEFVSADEIAEL